MEFSGVVMVDVREYYQVPIPMDAELSVQHAFIEINRILIYILQRQEKMRGLNGFTPEFAHNVEVGGYQIKHVADGTEPDDGVSVAQVSAGILEGGFGVATTLTLDASGEITVTGVVGKRTHLIDTYGAGASGDLNTINGGNEGEFLLLEAANDARTVVVKDGTNIKLMADFSLNNSQDKLLLVCKSSGVWHGVSRESSEN